MTSANNKYIYFFIYRPLQTYKSNIRIICHGGRRVSWRRHGQGHGGRQGQGQGHGGHLVSDFGRAVVHTTREEILKGRSFFPPHVILMGKWVKK